MLIKANNIQFINDEVEALHARIKDKCGVDIDICINSAGNAELLGAEAIIDIVCAALAVNKIALFGKRKLQKAVFARYICIKLIKQHLNIHDYKELGEIFNRDRTTIIHALQETDNLIETKQELFIQMLSTAQTALTEQITEL